MFLMPLGNSIMAYIHGYKWKKSDEKHANILPKAFYHNHKTKLKSSRPSPFSLKYNLYHN